MSAPLVIKLGGTLLEDAAALTELLAVCSQLQQQGRPLVLVHGGGSLVDQHLTQLGLAVEKRDGLRVTPPDHLPVVVGALAGVANTQLVATASVAGLAAIGLTLADGQLVKATAISELGRVGQVAPNRARLLRLLLDAGLVPVISSIAADDEGELLNINADDAAACICQLLGADLVLLSDVPGILDADGKLIAHLDEAACAELVSRGVIHGGMQVKVIAAQALANQIGKTISIGGWRDAADLLHGQGLGTTILPTQG